MTAADDNTPFVEGRGALLVLALTFLFGFWISGEGDGPCVKDPLLSVALNNNSTLLLQGVDPCSCFSETYQEARTKFISLVEKIDGATHISVPIVGEEYTMDFAIIPGTNTNSSDDDNRLVVHTSGVHGIEGYAGSAIQIAWLEGLLQYQQEKDSSSSSSPYSNHPTTIFIHAINPWGMAHYRRVNENNVDLNRNALLNFEEAVSRDPNLAHYQDFEAAFNPTSSDGFYIFWYELGTTILELSKYNLWNLRSGIQHLKKAMVTGQYHQPKGIFYGGTTLQPSLDKLYTTMETVILPQVMKKMMMRTTTKDDDADDESGRTTTKPLLTTTWINVHTGLGISGRDTLLYEPTISKFDSQDLVETFPGAAVPFLDATNENSKGKGEGDDVQQGYELTIGTLDSMLHQLLQKTSSSTTQCAATSTTPTEEEDDSTTTDANGSCSNNGDIDDTWIITQEFGTLPAILVGRALILENRAYHHGSTSSSTDSTNNHADGMLVRSAFYPRTTTWRRALLERGITRLYQAMQRRRRQREGA